MSGGSYGYLEHVEFYVPQHLREMSARLDGLDYNSAAARDTRRLIVLLEAVDHFATPELRECWHAVEWKDSFDWGEDQRDEVLDAYVAAGS